MFGSSTELITKGAIGHRKEIRVLTFRASALRLRESLRGLWVVCVTYIVSSETALLVGAW